MSDADNDTLGFTVWIEPNAGLSELAQIRFQRRLEDHLQGQDLVMGGGPLCGVISSPGRDVSAADQVELINHLVDDSAVRSLRISPIAVDLGEPAPREAGYLEVRALDLAVIGLTLLHRTRGVDAQTYLQLLGGFVRPATH